MNTIARVIFKHRHGQAQAAIVLTAAFCISASVWAAPGDSGRDQGVRLGVAVAF